MDGADDLAAVDALQVDACDPKVDVPKLTLDRVTPQILAAPAEQGLG